MGQLVSTVSDGSSSSSSTTNDSADSADASDLGLVSVDELSANDIVDYVAAVLDDDDNNNNTNCSNNYCVSDEEYIDMIREFIRPSPFEWFLIALYFVVFVVGIGGNLLVCIVVVNDRRMRTVTNLFIVNLSFADFLVIVVCLPPTVLGDVTETWYMGSAMCKIVSFLQGVSVSVSVLTLTVISIERYYAICHPLKFTKATVCRALGMVLAIWMTASFILLPEIVVVDTFRRFKVELQTDLLTTCKPTWDYQRQMAFQLFLIVALYFVPFIVMGVAYTSIAICLWSTAIPSESVSVPAASADSPSSAYVRHSDGTRSVSRFPKTKDARSQMISRRKVAKMLIAVVVMFGVCYLPVHLLNILRYAEVGMNDELGVKFALIAHWLCYFNSAINPVIYNFMSEKFQSAFKEVLSCRCRASRQTTQQRMMSAAVNTRLDTWRRSQHHTVAPPCAV